MIDIDALESVCQDNEQVDDGSARMDCEVSCANLA